MIIELDWAETPEEPRKRAGEAIRRLLVLEHTAPTAKEMHILMDLGFEIILVPRTRMPHSPFLDDRMIIDLMEEHNTFGLFTKDAFEAVLALEHTRVSYTVVPKRNEENVMVGALVRLP